MPSPYPSLISVRLATFVFFALHAGCTTHGTPRVARPNPPDPAPGAIAGVSADSTAPPPAGGAVVASAQALPIAQAAPNPPPTDPFTPVVQDVPARCQISRESIDTDPIKPAWCTAEPLPLGSVEETTAIAKILGEHSYTFQNAEIVDGETGEDAPVTSVDTLRVTRRDDGPHQLAVTLNFYNGHSCGFEGELRALSATTYRITDDDCQLLAEVQAKRLVFRNECPSWCATTNYCGARGGFNGTGIPLGHTRERPHAR